MPTSKKTLSRSKLSVQQLELDVPMAPTKSKRLLKSSLQKCDSKMGSRIYQRPSFENKDINTAYAADQTNAFIKVPPIELKFMTEPESSKSTPPRKERGYDFTSSTNSHFEGWILAAPYKFKRTCSSTSSTGSKVMGAISTSLKSTLPAGTAASKVGTSKEMYDSQHKASAPKRVNFNGPEWAKPCRESVVAGAPKPFVGTCPLNFEQFSKMSRTRQKFFLTQDPRRKYCLVNPKALRTKAFSAKMEFDILTATVKHADNVCADTHSHSSQSFICDQIDLQNPMQLDFQGLDYQSTYERDEQDMQQQRVYQRICRYMERRRVKAETENKVEAELEMERLAVPKCFDVEDRNKKEESIASEEPVPYSKLFRAADKPYNQVKIEQEKRDRRNHYKNLYLRRKQRAEHEADERKKQEEADEELKAATLAAKNFTDVLGTINSAIDHNYNMSRLIRKPEEQRRKFPHTTNETIRFKHELKQQNRVKRDKARVKKEFFLDRLGVEKSYPEADLEISSDTARHSGEDAKLSEQSSDDEDAIQVGKEGSIIKLRGFHYKLGPSLRGKRHKREKSEKTCITREQWLSRLAPKKETIKLDIEEGILKLHDPDDPELLLFPPQFGMKLPQIKSSAVREYVQKRLGRHYERDTRKKFKMVRPRLKYSIKKFNLIRFLFDDPVRATLMHTKTKSEQVKTDQNDLMQLNTTLEYIRGKENLRKQEEALKKQKRLELLGIPCEIVRKSTLQARCEQSDSGSDTDWVPEAEPELQDQEEENEKAIAAKSVLVPLRARGNMPAPLFRETTLRRHPRKPRNYAAERVASVLFDEAVKITGKPHMIKLMPDQIEFGNLREVRERPYSHMFEARHHHDHWIPTQVCAVDVHYQPKIIKPKVTHVEGKADHAIFDNFQMAHPPCNEFVEMDLTMPRWDTDDMIDDYLVQHKKKVTDVKSLQVKNLCEAKDFVFHSRPDKELEKVDFPGRREYLNFLHEVRQALYESKVEEDEGVEKLAVDRDELIKELDGDLDSIESCITSLSSSECTNLTNDSGSFLLMEGKSKIPLDYIRKSVVPFEEINRCRFELEPFDMIAEHANPFRVLPFSGQRKAQKELSTMKDSFFTFNTRLQNGMRLRLEVPVEDVRHKLIGKGKSKYHGAVTIDIDENYVDELKNRPPVKMFNFKSGRSFIKDALRLKFESMLIQGQIVRTKIYDRLNEHNWDNMMRAKLLYEKLFAKWEKREYEAAMAVVHKVKSYYEATDLLKREFRELERQQILLNMDIVFIEGHWIRRIMLQNFHYLLGDHEWRYKHDWIHRVEYAAEEADLEENEEEFEEDSSEESTEVQKKTDVELENYEDSILKRNVVNIRKRDKDDAWAIKSYYEEVYLQNLHPVLFVFPDAEHFMQGIENLKSKTFVLLLEMHFTLSIHTELQSRLESFEEWCLQDLREKQEYVSRKCAKLYFMSDRAEELKRFTIDFLDTPIEESFGDESFIKHRAVIAEVWRDLVSANMRTSSGEDTDPIQMVAMISSVVMELIAKFESIPVEQSRRIEATLRRKRSYEQKISRVAYQVEKRIEGEMKKVRRNLEPPYVKPKRVGKLPRIHIKKKEKAIVVKEQRISEHTKFFFRAFHDAGDVMQSSDARDSMLVMDTIQEQIVPFYFDHFLKLNGYTPNYNFKTNVELRDGPEEARVAVQNLVPNIVDKLEKWDAARKRTMEDNISRNPKMYENVQF